MVTGAHFCWRQYRTHLGLALFGEVRKLKYLFSNSYPYRLKVVLRVSTHSTPDLLHACREHIKNKQNPPNKKPKTNVR